MKNTLETRLGLFFAMAMITMVILLEMVGGIDGLRGGKRITARFANALELKTGDPVKLAGVQVGRVDKMNIAEGQVEVVIRLDRRQEKRVRTDSVATIKFLGLMGQNYVSISFGTKGDPVEEGTALKTIEQPDLSQLMTRVENVAGGVETMTRSFSGVSFQSLFAPFTDFLKENKDRLGGILANVSNVTAQVASGQGTVGQLVYGEALHRQGLETLTNFQETAVAAKQAIERVEQVISQLDTQLEAGEGTIGKLVKDEALYREAVAAMTNLREVLQKINQGQGSVGKLVNDESLFKNAKLTLQKLDKATEGLEDQGPLSVLGMAVGSLF